MAVCELFVWYRVRRDRAEAARSAVGLMQRALAAEWPGLRARLLVRDDGEIATWMETYARAASAASGQGGIDAAIEVAIAAAAQPLDALIEGSRHVEAFDLAGA